MQLLRQTLFVKRFHVSFEQVKGVGTLLADDNIGI